MIGRGRWWKGEMRWRCKSWFFFWRFVEGGVIVSGIFVWEWVAYGICFLGRGSLIVILGLVFEFFILLFVCFCDFG